MAVYLKLAGSYFKIDKLLKVLVNHKKEKLDLIEASRLIVSLWSELNLDLNQESYLGIVSIDSQTDHLPKGSVRTHWNKQSLEKNDVESQECEVYFAEVFQQSCEGMLLYLSQIDG